MFEPHGEMEQPDPTFYEALTTLTAIGAVTERIELGTGSLIPFRHPLATALTVGTLDRPGRRPGDHRHGCRHVRPRVRRDRHGRRARVELVKSNADILRRLFTEDDVSYADDHYQFEHVTIEPKPSKPVPFWYCGATPKSARLAAEYADGWMPGRTTLLTIEARAETMRQLTSENGRPMPTVAVIPPTSIADTTEQAWKGLNVDGLIAWANKRGKWWVTPPSGSFSTAEDIEGSLIAGNPAEVVEQTRRFEKVGVEHLVFDLRLRFDRWFSGIELLGREVLPALRS